MGEAVGTVTGANNEILEIRNNGLTYSVHCQQVAIRNNARRFFLPDSEPWYIDPEPWRDPDTMVLSSSWSQEIGPVQGSEPVFVTMQTLTTPRIRDLTRRVTSVTPPSAGVSGSMQVTSYAVHEYFEPFVFDALGSTTSAPGRVIHRLDSTAITWLDALHYGGNELVGWDFFAHKPVSAGVISQTDWKVLARDGFNDNVRPYLVESDGAGFQPLHGRVGFNPSLIELTNGEPAGAWTWQRQARNYPEALNDNQISAWRQLPTSIEVAYLVELNDNGGTPSLEIDVYYLENGARVGGTVTTLTPSSDTGPYAKTGSIHNWYGYGNISTVVHGRTIGDGIDTTDWEVELYQVKGGVRTLITSGSSSIWHKRPYLVPGDWPLGVEHCLGVPAFAERRPGVLG